jgi:hypothetical protein
MNRTTTGRAVPAETMRKVGQYLIPRIAAMFPGWTPPEGAQYPGDLAESALVFDGMSPAAARAHLAPVNAAYPVAHAAPVTS